MKSRGKTPLMWAGEMAQHLRMLVDRPLGAAYNFSSRGSNIFFWSLRVPADYMYVNTNRSLKGILSTSHQSGCLSECNRVFRHCGTAYTYQLRRKPVIVSTRPACATERV